MGLRRLCRFGAKQKIMRTIEKGSSGEQAVSAALAAAFPTSPRFDNLVIPGLGGLTQIDHVLVHPTGVFVIETKKYRGVINGRPEHPLWAQRIGSTRRDFQNPRFQNARHVSAVRWQIGLTAQQVHSVIVFVGRVELACPIADNVIATHAAGCPHLVRYLQSSAAEQVSSHQIARCVYRLTAWRSRVSLSES